MKNPVDEGPSAEGELPFFSQFDKSKHILPKDCMLAISETELVSVGALIDAYRSTTTTRQVLEAIATECSRGANQVEFINCGEQSGHYVRTEVLQEIINQQIEKVGNE